MSLTLRFIACSLEERQGGMSGALTGIDFPRTKEILDSHHWRWSLQSFYGICRIIGDFQFPWSDDMSKVVHFVKEEKYFFKDQRHAWGFK